ncbi:MAG: 50S ribosomal protein L25 [Opitutales bacterium]
MKQLRLSVKNRSETGRGPMRRLRASGRIPAVIYGEGGSRALSLDGPEFRTLMRQAAGSAALVEVSDDAGKQTLSVIQTVERDPVTDHFVHVDFHEVSASKPMHARVPVHTEGTPYGVKNENAILDVQLHELDVECLPKDLPEHVTVDVTELHAGDSVHIRDLKAIEGVSFLGDDETVVLACAGKSKKEEAEGAEAAAEAEPAAT